MNICEGPMKGYVINTFIATDTLVQNHIETSIKDNVRMQPLPVWIVGKNSEEFWNCKLTEEMYINNLVPVEPNGNKDHLK